MIVDPVTVYGAVFTAGPSGTHAQRVFAFMDALIEAHRRHVAELAAEPQPKPRRRRRRATRSARRRNIDAAHQALEDRLNAAMGRCEWRL